jgi:hypothetical protein
MSAECEKLGDAIKLLEHTNPSHNLGDPKSWDLDTIKIVAQNALKASTTTNAFYLQDAEDNGKPNQLSIRRLLARFAVTNVEVLPSWNKEEAVLREPKYWEKWWYAVYEICGPVANQAKDFMRKVRKVNERKAKDVQDKIAKANQPAKVVTEKSAKKSKRKQKKKPKNKSPNRKHMFFYKVGFEATERLEKGDMAGKHKVASDGLVGFFKTVFEVDPEAMIHRNEANAKGDRKAKPITIHTPDKHLPGNTWNCSNFARGYYVSDIGWEPRGVIRIATDMEPDKFLELINSHEGEEEGAYEVSVHPIQGAFICTAAYLGRSHKDLDMDLLSSQIMATLPFQKLLKRKPNLTIECTWEAIKVEKGEPIKKGRRVMAVMVKCKTEDRGDVLEGLIQVYNPKKKTGFPLHIKFTVLGVRV